MTAMTDISRRPVWRRVTPPSSHAFAVGQAVCLKRALLGIGNVYLITAQLPPVGDAPQYRIRNEGEKFERVATQDNLEYAPAATGGARAAFLERSFGA
jgi:hypothetical protein